MYDKRIGMSEMDREWIRALPKVELHCHLDGSMRLDTIRDFLAEMTMDTDGSKLPENDDAARALLQAPADCASLDEYLKRFDLPVQCLQTAGHLKKAAYELVRDAAAENVVYLEMRFAPALSVHPGLGMDEVIGSVVNGMQEGKRDFGVYGGVILCGMRHMDPKINIQVAETAGRFLGKGVCGVDLAGGEADFPPEIHRDMFKKAREMGIPITIHAGECGSSENIRTAIQMGASRIGHGIAAKGDPSILNMCRDHHVLLEMCPTSNLQTKAVNDLSDHPMKDFLSEGLYVCINTDNRTVSATSMSREIELAMEKMGLGRMDIWNMMAYAADAAFAPEDIRRKIHVKLEKFKEKTLTSEM